MQKETANPDIWADASDRYMRRKLKQAVKEWQTERKANGQPWRIEDLGKEMHYHRNMISRWLNGEASPPMDAICNFFKKDPSYFVAQNLDELDIVNEQHHRQMQNYSAELASRFGVSKSFLWYLKSDQKLQNMIINNQPTDAMLNSFDPDVPDVGSPYQFILSSGEKAYLNEYSMPMLGRIESKVKEYIEYLLWSEYKRRKE